MARRHGGWTKEQAMEVYQETPSYTFNPPTDVRRGGNGRWYVFAECKLCGRTSWQSIHGFRNRIGCCPDCKEYEEYPRRLRPRNESPYNWDLLKFWPKQVTWSRANADF